MTRTFSLVFAISSIAGFAPSYAQHAMIDDKDVKASLKGTAPDTVIDHATLMNMDKDGKMKVVQQGTNGWTCMPGRVGPRWPFAHVRRQTGHGVGRCLAEQRTRATEAGLHLHDARRQRGQQL